MGFQKSFALHLDLHVQLHTDDQDLFLESVISNQEDAFHSAHPSGWTESVSRIGIVCLSVCDTLMIINITAYKLHRPL